MYQINNVSRQPVSYGHCQSNMVDRRIPDGSNFQWSLSHPMTVTSQPNKRLAEEFLPNPGSELPRFDKARSVEFVSSQAFPQSFYRCYSLPGDEAIKTANFGDAIRAEHQVQGVKRKVPWSLMNTSHSNGEYSIAGRTTKERKVPRVERNFSCLKGEHSLARAMLEDRSVSKTKQNTSHLTGEYSPARVTSEKRGLPRITQNVFEADGDFTVLNGINGGHTKTVCDERSSILRDARRVLHSVDSNFARPPFCPNIMHMCTSTPSFLQRGQFNFRQLNTPTFGIQSEQIDSLRWHITNSLKRHGVCVINRFMGLLSGESISEEVKSLHQNRICGNGRSVGKNFVGKPVREDLVTWLDGTEPQYPNIRTLCTKLDDVVGRGAGVTTENYSICGSTKVMVARYKGEGAGYRLHVDNPTKDGRCLTCIYYVNKGWNSERMGGNLKLYAKTSGKTAEIQPIFDRVVFFYSDARNPHEVLPAYEDRYAVTVWYFDLTQRAKAIERLKAMRAQQS